MKLISIEWHPSDRQLRQFGLTALVALPVLGWLCKATELRMGLLAAIGLLAAGLALVYPRGLRPIFVGLTLVTFPIGWVVSELALVALFFGAVVPIGWILRAVGHDPLDREFDRQANSYWQPRKPPSGIASYFRRW